MNEYLVSYEWMKTISQIHLPYLTQFPLQNLWTVALHLIVQVHILRQYLKFELVRLAWVYRLLHLFILIRQLLHVWVTERQVLRLIYVLNQLLQALLSNQDLVRLKQTQHVQRVRSVMNHSVDVSVRQCEVTVSVLWCYYAEKCPLVRWVFL